MTRTNKEDTEMEKLLQKASQIIYFPGNVEEYEKFRGYKVEIMDTEGCDKGVTARDLFIRYIGERKEIVDNLLNNDLEALVNLVQLNDATYGLPVRKKR